MFNLCLFLRKVVALCIHYIKQNLESNHEIGIYNSFVFPSLFIQEATGMYYAHLLDDRRLS